MLNTRELYLVLRARDEASRVMRNMGHTMKQLDKDTLAAAHAQMARGQAMATIGTGIAIAGAAGIAFFKNAVEAAIAYNQQAALTKTQTDQVKVSIEQLKAMSDDVASRIPVPFESLQSALYDIFSSIDVNVPQAHKLLNEFAKASVAGQTDIQVAGRATIAVLNAFKLPINDVTHVNDVLFQLVRKGVGTYEEFTKTIGRAIPSTARAGQSVETLAGMLAFMTRNGLSTAMAATSAARAMDAMSNPKTVQHFKDIGINVKDANGQFRPMNQIMTELGKKMANLTKPQRAKALQKLFLGSGGTIQARRFFDLAVTNFDELNQRVKDMHNSEGAMQSAYDVMFKQPLSQMQLFQNNWKVLQHQMGDTLLPILSRLAKAFAAVFMWFNKLSPATKKWVTIGLALASVLAVLVGVIVAVVGVVLMFAAAMALADIAMAPVLLAIGLIIAAIVALGIIVFLVIKYHKQIWAFIQTTWNTVKTFLINTWNSIAAFVGPWASKIWTTVSTHFMAGVHFVVDIVTLLFDRWVAIWKEIWVWVGPVLTAIWTIIKTVFGAIEAVFNFYLKVWFTIAKFYLTLIYTVVKTVITAVWKFLGPTLQIIYQLIRLAFRFAWLGVKTNVELIRNFIQVAWRFIKWLTQTAWNGIKMAIINPIRAAYNFARPWWIKITTSIRDVFNSVLAWVKREWAKFTSFIIDPIRNATSTMTGYLDSIVGKIQGFVDRITAPLRKARDLLSQLNPAAHFSPSIVDRTRWGWQDMEKASKAGAARVLRSMRGVMARGRTAISNFTPDGGGFGISPGGYTPPPPPGGGYGGGGRNVSVDMKVYTEEINPIKQAADLGWEVARAL